MRHSYNYVSFILRMNLYVSMTRDILKLDLWPDHVDWSISTGGVTKVTATVQTIQKNEYLK